MDSIKQIIPAATGSTVGTRPIAPVMISETAQEQPEALHQACRKTVCTVACVWNHLHGTIVPQFNHVLILLVGDRQRVTEHINKPFVDSRPACFSIRFPWCYACGKNAHILA